MREQGQVSNLRPVTGIPKAVDVGLGIGYPSLTGPDRSTAMELTGVRMQHVGLPKHRAGIHTISLLQCLQL
jgi:hypothetical protein